MTGTIDRVSTHSARLRAARRLTKRAFRQRERAFLAEGPQAVAEAFASGAPVTDLFVTVPARGRHDDLVTAMAAAGIGVHVVSGEVMDELAQTVTPQGLLAVCGFVDVPLSRAVSGTLVALLANVRDPGNAGTVLRTADAAGADAVVFADASVDPYNGKCVRASAGSLFHLPVVAGTRLEEAVAAMRAAGLRIVAADGRAGLPLDDDGVQARLAEPTAWLFGNEAWGLPPELVALADEPVAVPIYGQAESLNLAAAAAVCLYASARAQRTPPVTGQNRMKTTLDGLEYLDYNIENSRFRTVPGAVFALESDHNPSPQTVTTSGRRSMAVAASPDGGFAAVDELMASSDPEDPGSPRTPRNRETVTGPASVVSPLPEGPVPIGSLVFADELPDGVVVADEVGRIVVFNRAAARLTGLDPAEMIGKFVFDVLPLRDAEGRDWWVYADPYHGLATRTRHPERSLYLADGTEVLVCVGYVRDTAGPPRPVRRLVISLRGAQARERLERSRAELVSTVAHELRSPLTSVKGFTATLLNKWSRFTDDQKRVMLETVNADADRVTRLITELLDVSRIESGRMEVHRQLVDVPDRARKIIAGRVAAGDAEDRFRLVVRPGLPETWLDADKIDQILGNLVENAVRHGAGIVTVVVEPAHIDDQESPDAVAVCVRDQGEGISPDVAPRVFRQFWRGKPRGGSRTSRHGGGTGLGLYIVKGLVEALGGTIGVSRAPGGGAEFRFTVPAGAPAA